jgi:4-hydroxybenzoate polyprenyltransferase
MAYVQHPCHAETMSSDTRHADIVTAANNGTRHPDMKNIIRLLRPHQYVKNVAIFLPLFFAMRITSPGAVLVTLAAFIAFSLCASGIYILNDYRDIEDDRRHPRKKNRPLASGAVSPGTGFLLMAGLFVTGFTIMGLLSVQALLILAGYVLMNIAYSFSLKHISILDVTIIAIGFVLRLFVGAAVTGIPLSMWIIVITFLLALFLALAKRRDDVLVFLDTGEKMRRVIDGYNLQFLDGAMMVMASVVIVAYLLYTTSPEIIAKLHSRYLYLTAFFVVLGIMRYMQIAFVEQNSGSPSEVLLKDRFIQLTLLGWIGTFGWILYF